MSIYTFDCETQGLDTNKFLMGSICDERLRTETFTSKQALWARLMQIAQQHKKQGKCAMFYAHNCRYDWYCVRPFPEPSEAMHYSNEPFIVDFEDEEHRIYAKFTSTTSLWRGSLKSLGEAIGHHKGETPAWLLLDSYEPDFMELQHAAAYNRQDTVVLMQYLLDLRNRLKGVGMRPRWILTAAQIAISYFLNEAARAPNADDFFSDKIRKVLIATDYPNHLKAACRGGRTHALITGTREHVTYADINSAYPYHFAHLRCPNLRTERFIKYPLRGNLSLTYLLGRIGVTCATVTTAVSSFGPLPIRPTVDYVYWPRTAGQRLRGVWTHQELAAALERGFTINEIEWSIIYEETDNPFRATIEKLYKLKQHAANENERAFAKMLLNGAIGKFSQEREQVRREWDDVRNHEARLADGWIAIEQDKTQRLYKKRFGINYPRWHAPIINALVRADAHLRLLHFMESIGPERMLYADTDSLLFSGDSANTSIKYTNEMGDFKLAGSNLTLTVWGKKAYALGDELKLSGAGNITATDLAKGLVVARKMLTDTDTADASKVGTFTSVQHDLNALLTAQATLEAQYEREPYLVDERLLNFEEH